MLCALINPFDDATDFGRISPVMVLISTIFESCESVSAEAVCKDAVKTTLKRNKKWRSFFTAPL